MTERDARDLPAAEPSGSNAATSSLRESLHFEMAKIRFFEEALLDLFQNGQLTGTTHTYLGQEATAVAALSHMRQADFVLSQHRSHGYYLAAGNSARDLFLEIVGDRRGVCEGIGGSQHLYTRNFLSNGIVGGTAGLAVGIALAAKQRANGIAISFVGDGTLGEGLLYEAFNLASLWSAPVLYVVENNRYAQTTPVEKGVAGDILARAMAFGIEGTEIESNDAIDLYEAFAPAFAFVRGQQRPYCVVVHTYRAGPHSKGDDFRPAEELHRWKAKDPLAISASAIGVRARVLEARARSLVSQATQLPSRVEPLPLANLGDDRALVPAGNSFGSGIRSADAGRRYVEVLQRAFAELFEADQKLMMIGEDIADPYGGAFKACKGLSTRFPTRVFSTPISEAGIVAAANGLALKGYRPIVEVMFGDFVTLTVDQIVNHAAKFAQMFRDQAVCPVVVRVPSGGYRGYGPTHSQSLEKMFLGIPGLVVTSADEIHDPTTIWRRMLALSTPCVHVENKSLYTEPLPLVSDGRMDLFALDESGSYFPTTRLSLDGAAAEVDAAIVVYGGMTGLALKAALVAFQEHELVVDVVVVTQIAPIPKLDLQKYCERARAILTLEEGTQRAGFGAEVLATLAEAGVLASRPAARTAAHDAIIPANPSLERDVLPSVPRIVSALRELVS